MRPPRALPAAHLNATMSSLYARRYTSMARSLISLLTSLKIYRSGFLFLINSEVPAGFQFLPLHSGREHDCVSLWQQLFGEGVGHNFAFGFVISWNKPNSAHTHFHRISVDFTHSGQVRLNRWHRIIDVLPVCRLRHHWSAGRLDRVRCSVASIESKVHGRLKDSRLV